MIEIKLSKVKKGEFVKRKPNSQTVYSRGDYERSIKKYSLIDEEDICREIFLKGSTIVYIGFEH